MSLYTPSNVRYCEVQSACDGSRLMPGRDICGACERAQKKLVSDLKRGARLRGERCESYRIERKR